MNELSTQRAPTIYSAFSGKEIAIAIIAYTNNDVTNRYGGHNFLFHRKK
jgi:hypothetical protein